MERKLRCESSREDERRPWLWLLAGPNGAGKSTYAPKLAALVDEIVRPDELAYQLSREAPERVALAAGRLAVQRINELLEQRRSFAIETTLSGRLHLQVVERATRAEWSIGVVYIALGSPELAVERVRERTSRGGHYVPANDVRRRFARSLRNLSSVSRHADRLLVLDNSSTRGRMKRVLEAKSGEVVFRRKRFPRWLDGVIPAILAGVRSPAN